MKMNIQYPSPIKLFILALALLLPASASAQRDYLTPEEIEIVRNAQSIDLRIDVLTHAIDRRFSAMNVSVNAPKVKKGGDWGELPAGSREELFHDIRRLLQKAVDDIDNLAERPDSAVEDITRKKQEQGFQVLFPKAVRNLAAAAQRYMPVLHAQLDSAASNSEKGFITGALDLCQEIVDAVAKLPADAPKKPAKKT